MPHINLIHEQVAQRRQLEKKTSIAMLALAGTTVLSFCTLGWMFLQTNATNDALATAKKKHEAIQPKIDQISANANEFSVLGPKVDTLERAQKATKRWSSVLTHLSHNTPQGIFLTSMHCSQASPSDNVTMTLSGKGPEQGTIADFLTRLQNHLALQGVNLNYTAKEPDDHLKFEINSQLVGTAYDTPVQTEEKKS